MDFTFDEQQQEIQGLARRILERVTHERLKELETAGAWDRKTWADLAAANLAGVAVPAEHGGLGFGLIETALVLQEVGRAVAPVPALATLVLGAMPIAQFGGGEKRERWLPGVASGDVILTAALTEPLNPSPLEPVTTFRDGVLDGVKTLVPYAGDAAVVVVPAVDDAGDVVLVLLDPTAPGVQLERQETTDNQPNFKLTMTDAPGAMLTAEPGALRWLVDRATAGLCATQLGVAEKALEITAAYTSSRQQFGRPIASNQAVAHRAADAYIDTEGIRLTTWQAVWRLAEGLDAANELAVAKWWVAEGGQRVAHATQHLHGGIGVDVDYPLHRYFRWAKQHELTLGAAAHQIAQLGAALAREPV